MGNTRPSNLLKPLVPNHVAVSRTQSDKPRLAKSPGKTRLRETDSSTSEKRKSKTGKKLKSSQDESGTNGTSKKRKSAKLDSSTSGSQRRKSSLKNSIAP